ncbi:hypothetical protein T636_A0693 [Enterobacter hormaechei subsp. xiangfangensis]|nr:hypothetical protein T636_A0693 [Enterobacter hormaechei subsp. xiangfangensis]
MESKIIQANPRNGWVNADIGIKMPPDAVELLWCCVMNKVMFEKGFEPARDLFSSHKLVEFVFAYHLAGGQYFIQLLRCKTLFQLCPSDVAQINAVSIRHNKTALMISLFLAKQGIFFQAIDDMKGILSNLFEWVLQRLYAVFGFIINMGFISRFYFCDIPVFHFYKQQPFIGGQNHKIRMIVFVSHSGIIPAGTLFAEPTLQKPCQSFFSCRNFLATAANRGNNDCHITPTNS